MDRRVFLKTAAGAAAIIYLGSCGDAQSQGNAVGKVLKPWKKGQLQVHFIYTGVGESMFWILPDGTTMLLDCGDHNAIGRGKLAVPVLPDSNRHSGEWIARYVERVNPQKQDVDYIMLSHLHSDHAGTEGFNSGVVEHDGKPYPLSGFTQAGETLHFHKAIDRGYPSYDDPLPLVEGSENWNIKEHMMRLYEWKRQTDGLTAEKFRLGETDQIAMLHAAGKYPSFHIRNITANGRIALKDGSIRNLYKERIDRQQPKTLNENGMSLGVEVTYGDFRFVCCGDFSDNWTLEDGTKFEIEDALSEAVSPAHVTKLNHHGHYSMPENLIKALRSRVWVSCVWDQLHNVAPVMDRLSDRGLYPGERLICPGIFPKERCEEDAGKTFLKDIEPSAFEGGHVVLTVEKGGKEYSVAYVGAQDEEMIVKSVTRLNTEEL